MKSITIALSALLTIGTISAMDDDKHITFYNKNLPTILISFRLLNHETGGYGHYSHTIKCGKEKTFDFSYFSFLSKTKVTFKSAAIQPLKLKISPRNNIITIKTNKDGKVIAQCDQHSNLSNSR